MTKEQIATINNLSYSALDIELMRDWILDCGWPDVDEEEINNMSDETILIGIETHYSGGVTEFMLNN